jgi:hypothetical protein
MKAETVLGLFEHAARPSLNFFARNTCIEQTRILIEVLKRFGIEAEPLATKLHVVCPAKRYQFLLSGDPADLRNAKRFTPRVIERKNDADETLGYHTVTLVGGRRLLVDLTLAQASSEEFDFAIDPQTFVLPLPFAIPPDELPDLRLECATDAGVPFTVRYIGVPDRDWERAPAWEPSHLWALIDLIEWRMRRAA